MANKKQATKRARQSNDRRKRNQPVRQNAKTVLKRAVEAVKKGDLQAAKGAYVLAIRTLAKAASKKQIPANRASRTASRLTHLVKKTLPEALNFKN